MPSRIPQCMSEQFGHIPHQPSGRKVYPKGHFLRSQIGQVEFLRNLFVEALEDRDELPTEPGLLPVKPGHLDWSHESASQLWVLVNHCHAGRQSCYDQSSTSVIDEPLEPIGYMMHYFVSALVHEVLKFIDHDHLGPTFPHKGP